MSLRVIGTAGHVDHGKSTLIQALTGTHPDRLKEEKDREMTIDLGFGWWTLPNGEEIGVVDVPGHIDFIENMLAGIGGIDAVLFVVAADEGVMPQTREHLAILDLLQINAGVVALTKIDMVDDESWLDLVEEELDNIFGGTVLESAEIIRVSAKEKIGLRELETALEKVLVERPSQKIGEGARLPIDRVFTMTGFGTVVTGTLVGGRISVGDEVMVLPGDHKGRIRGLQTHKRKGEHTEPGSRVAVNISGIGVDEISRGQVVVYPNTFKTTRRIDVTFDLLNEVSLPLKHNSEMKFFVGAAEVLARVRVLGVETLNPGESGWLQLELREPVVTERGDRFILRRPSPSETIGGGMVLDIDPEGRHKRYSEEVVERLSALAKGDPEDVLWQIILGMNYGDVEDVIEKSGLDEKIVLEMLIILLENEKIVLFGDIENNPSGTLVANKEYFNKLNDKVQEVLEKYHLENPLKRGIPRQELINRIQVSQKMFDSFIEELAVLEKIIEDGPIIYKIDFVIKFTPDQNENIKRLMTLFVEKPFSPPTIKNCIEIVGEDVYQAMVGLGNLLPISSEVVFQPEDYKKAVENVRNEITKNGPVSLGSMRDLWGTTRRYVQALLEFMDKEGVTVREGDVRKLK